MTRLRDIRSISLLALLPGVAVRAGVSSFDLRFEALPIPVAAENAFSPGSPGARPMASHAALGAFALRLGIA